MKVGDVVRLRSRVSLCSRCRDRVADDEGPMMTIVDMRGDEMRCVYFWEGELRQVQLPTAALVVVQL